MTVRELLSSLKKPLAAGLLLLLIGSASYRLTYLVALDREVAALAVAASHRLDAAASELSAPLARFEFLPALLETTPPIMQLLAKPRDPALRDIANQTLTRINAVAGANMVFVLDPSGLALAAADWSHPDTPVGHLYAYRPYVRDALASGRGRFFGIGATSNKAGYYLSYALQNGANTIGVATVKIDLDPVERTWASQAGDVLVTDEHGVVILSSQSDWKFHASRPISADEQAAIASERPYPPVRQTLPWLDPNTPLTSGMHVWIAEREHLLTSRALPLLGWQLHALDDLAAAHTQANNAAMVVSLATAVALLLGMAAWQSRRAALAKLAAQAQLQAAHDSLEQRVRERTAQLVDLNASLQAEIATRTAVENHLHETQEELIQAAKMAVLGELSVGLAHELNQPLAAMRTLSDNALVLMDQQRLPETRGNIARLAQLVQRLGETTRRLKTFAHKHGETRGPVPVLAAVSNAGALLGERMKRQRVRFEVTVEPENLCVLADLALLEQVLVNLFANAIDAMADSSNKLLQVQAQAQGQRVIIEVSDNGSGIAPAMFATLFEAFSTSKPRGAGLGLGLMISQRIVREFGGQIQARNKPTQGAVFTIELPLFHPSDTP